MTYGLAPADPKDPLKPFKEFVAKPQGGFSVAQVQCMLDYVGQLEHRCNQHYCSACKGHRWVVGKETDVTQAVINPCPKCSSYLTEDDAAILAKAFAIFHR